MRALPEGPFDVGVLGFAVKSHPQSNRCTNRVPRSTKRRASKQLLAKNRLPLDRPRSLRPLGFFTKSVVPAAICMRKANSYCSMRANVSGSWWP